MGKRKGGGGGSGGGGGDGCGGGGGATNPSPCTPPDQKDQSPCDKASTDHARSAPCAVPGADGNTSKCGPGGGKVGGTLLTAVLKMDFHCDGCEDKIRRSIKGFKGVEGVKMDRNANRVTVAGTMDPWKLRDRIQTKTKKMVEVLSPTQKKQGGGGCANQNTSQVKNCDKEQAKKEDCKQNYSCNPKEEGKKDDNKQAFVVNTIVLKVALHCDGCIMRIRGVLMKIEGVEQVSIEFQKNQITIKGTMKTKGFAEFLSKKIQRRVELMCQKEQKENKNQNEEREKEGKKEERNCAQQITCHAGMGWCHCDKCVYHVYMAPAPQLFSDENPNACAVM